MARSDHVDAHAKITAVAIACACAMLLLAATPSPQEKAAEVRVGAGVACTGGGAPGPPSYRVRDIGKPGVPAVSARNRATVRAIMRYVHPTTLRFAFLENGKEFAVFDAVNGPCTGGPVVVLNDPACNAMVVLYDGMGRVGALPECFMAPRPWIAHDHGNPHGVPWTQYDNSH